MTTKPTTKTTTSNLPEGMHAESGVEYLARLSGFEGDRLPAVVILTKGFSETTGFFRESKGRGYYQTTFDVCSCPDYRFRKAGTGKLCKHQSNLIKIVQQREFDEAHADYLKAKATYRPEPLPNLDQQTEGVRLPPGVSSLSKAWGISQNYTGA